MVPTLINKDVGVKLWSSSVVPDSLQPHGLQPTKLLCPWDFSGKSTGVGCHFLLQGILPTQGLNLGLPHCRQTLLPSEPPGKPIKRKLGNAINVFISCCSLCGGYRKDRGRKEVENAREEIWLFFSLLILKPEQSCTSWQKQSYICKEFQRSSNS